MLFIRLDIISSPKQEKLKDRNLIMTFLYFEILPPFIYLVYEAVVMASILIHFEKTVGIETITPSNIETETCLCIKAS